MFDLISRGIGAALFNTLTGSSSSLVRMRATMKRFDDKEIFRYSSTNYLGETNKSQDQVLPHHYSY